ncbi:MAG: VWA domain-containing protein [Candidatus Omnitrophica bacterium]|nr:VWA domain-containing protein [Candidatus Omnitrophota bacterium]
MDIVFKNPQFFILLLLLPLLYIFTIKSRRRSSIRFSSFSLLKQMHLPSSFFAIRIPIVLRSLVFLLIVIALARPQIREAERERTSEGIDIILALDISGSMKAEDFQPANRLEIAKEEANRFIKGRPHDRIGLVIFSQQSFTQCPLTLDHDVLCNLLSEIQIGMIQDGTAIGLAIANAINRLQDSNAKSKIIILLTDGENNAGQIDPLMAAEIARTFNIKIYTIGIGKEGMVPYPVDDPLFGRRYMNVDVKIDEKTLMKIATLTNGLYFRARDQKSLEEIYKEINRLEKTEMQVKEYVSFLEVFSFFIYLALMVLIIEIVATHTVFFKIP